MIPAWIVAFNEEAERISGQNNSLAAVLQMAYSHMRRSVFPKLTPLLQSVKKNGGAKWGGQGVFFDVVVSRYVPKGSLYVMDSPFSSVRTVYSARPYGVITGITP